MTTSPPRARRLLLTGGFVLALATAPALGSAPWTAAHVLACDAGEEQDPFSEACVPHTVPNSPSVGTSAANPDIPEVDGVPCTGRNSGQCIGLAENGPAFVPPTSSVGSSPTIHGVE